MEPQQALLRPEAEDVLVIHFAGGKVSLYSATAGDVEERLLAITAEHSAPEVIVNFANVDFVCSTTLGMLLNVHKNLAGNGRRLQIENVTPRIYEVFSVTGLDRLFPIHAGAASPENLCPRGVLVADDDKHVRSMLEARLAAAGFRVWPAVNGRHAVDLYRRHRRAIAMVLLEVLMPGLDGPRTLRHLRELCPSLRCCFMCGNPRPYPEAALLQMGAFKVFRKPFAAEDIIDTLFQVTDLSSRHGTERWLELAPTAPGSLHFDS